MTNQPLSTAEGLLLPGLDGSNPLGFLAALGVLRTLGLADSGGDIRMAWRRNGGTWCPMLTPHIPEDVLTERLSETLQRSDPGPWSIHKKLPFEAELLRDAISTAYNEATMDGRQSVDMLGAFGSEAIENDAGVFADTALRMVRAGDSAGQGLLAYGKRIREETTRENIHEALFAIWKHEDANCALRWDPGEARNYALRWTNPSKEKTGSVRGANRLALEALPVLTAIPVGRRVATVGFSRIQRRSESFTWPIWSVATTLAVVKSLVTMSELQCENPSVDLLRPRGIAAIYRSDRVMMNQYYSNFTPARCVA